jgi:hypothetical protein
VSAFHSATTCLDSVLHTLELIKQSIPSTLQRFNLEDISIIISPYPLPASPTFSQAFFWNKATGTLFLPVIPCSGDLVDTNGRIGEGNDSETNKLQRGKNHVQEVEKTTKEKVEKEEEELSSRTFDKELEKCLVDTRERIEDWRESQPNSSSHIRELTSKISELQSLFDGIRIRFSPKLRNQKKQQLKGLDSLRKAAPELVKLDLKRSGLTFLMIPEHEDYVLDLRKSLLHLPLNFTLEGLATFLQEKYLNPLSESSDSSISQRLKTYQIINSPITSSNLNLSPEPKPQQLQSSSSPSSSSSSSVSVTTSKVSNNNSNNNNVIDSTTT